MVPANLPVTRAIEFPVAVILYHTRDTYCSIMCTLSYMYVNLMWPAGM